MTCGICTTNFYVFHGKAYSFDNYEIANAFKKLKHLLANINYTAIQRNIETQRAVELDQLC